MEFHPIAAIFPLMDEQKLEELAADIRANGLKHPVILFEGKVLDGRNRFTACGLAGVKPRFDTFTGTKMQAVAHVWSLNMERRHLDPGQAAIAVAKRLKFDEDFAKEVEAMKADADTRMKLGKKDPAGNFRQGMDEPKHERATLHKIAESAGTNEKYVRQAVKLIDQAPEEAEKVAVGAKKLHQAVKDVAQKNNSCSNPNKDLPTADWPEMIKWCARQKSVSKEALMKKFANNEGDCRKRLAIAAQTAGYLVTYLGDGEYRVRKAVTLASESEDQKEHAAKLRDVAKAYLSGLTSSKASVDWSYQKQLEFLNEVIRFTDGLSG